MKKWIILMLAMSLPTLHAGDLEIDGNLKVLHDLNVTEKVKLFDNTLNIGHFSNIPEAPGIQFIYQENGANSTTSIRQGRGAAQWLWQRDGYGTATDQMKLDYFNVLTIGGGSSQIILDPGQGQIQVNGRLVLFSDQMPLGSNSNNTALALGLGTVSSAGGSMAIGYVAKATGYGSLAFGLYSESLAENTVALGSFSKANGLQSFALGTSAYASGLNSYSIGQSSTALGSGSMTIGNGSSAQGDASLAVGGSQHATGVQSLAIGMYSTVSGDASCSFGFDNTITLSNSFVLGRQTAISTASSYSIGAGNSISAISGYCFGEGMAVQTAGETVVGRYNLAVANGVTSDPEGLVFTVGNGANNSQRSNALEIKKNGNTKIYGTLTSTGGIRIQPQGDIPMGEFTSGSQP